MGFTSVMMDGSLMPDGKTPSSFEYNVDATRKVVEMAHAKGITVEGEIGCLAALKTAMARASTVSATSPIPTRRWSSSSSPAGRSGHRHRHQPRRLQVQQQAHRRDAQDGAAHRDPPQAAQRSPGDARLFQRAQVIAGHYQTSTGGKLKPTWGVPVEEIQLGIKNGVRKVNVDTDNRLAITGAIRKVFWETPESSIRATTSSPRARP